MDCDPRRYLASILLRGESNNLESRIERVSGMYFLEKLAGRLGKRDEHASDVLRKECCPGSREREDLQTMHYRGCVSVTPRILHVVVNRMIVSRNRLEGRGVRICECAAWSGDISDPASFVCDGMFIAISSAALGSELSVCKLHSGLSKRRTRPSLQRSLLSTRDWTLYDRAGHEIDSDRPLQVNLIERSRHRADLDSASLSRDPPKYISRPFAHEHSACTRRAKVERSLSAQPSRDTSAWSLRLP
jgi:hypothetical protein